MRFITLIVSMFIVLSLPALATATEEAPAPTASPAVTNPMDPKYQIFYPYNDTEIERQNPGGEWRRGPYGKMQYTPPVRKHTAGAAVTTTTTNTATTTRPSTDTTRVTVTVNVGVAPEGDVPPPGTTTAPPAVAPKKASAPWNWGWLWSTLKFLGYLFLLAAVAVGVWAVGRTWGVRAGAMTGVAVVIIGVLVWLALP